ncbi:MAG: metallophosphoesterase [Candidatus Cryptobacteroides sp.]
MEFATAFIVIIAGVLVLGIIILIFGGLASLCRIGFRRFWRYARWMLLIPPAAICYGILAERNLFEVNEVEICSDNIPESFDGYRIVQISDIHLRSFANRHKALERAVSMIMDCRPDMIVFTGDLISLSVDETDGCMEILSRLEAPDGVWSVMGNHDYLTHSMDLTDVEKTGEIARLKRIERAIGWNLLENAHADIFRPDSSCISLIGVENLSSNPQFPSYGDIPAALNTLADKDGTLRHKLPEGTFKILLSHDPSAWDAYVAGGTDIDLTLSGHTHDMQLSLPGFSPSALFYERHKGLYTIGNQSLYVNIGLGETIFPARIGARPEITLLELVRPSEEVSDSRHVRIFDSGNPESIPYRIPALAGLPDGTLVAFGDYRHSREDIGTGRVDIRARISADGGREWGKEFAVIEGSGTEGAPDCGFGDAAVVADRETGELLLMTVCGQTVYWRKTTNRQNPNRIALMRSEDGGKTWDGWTEVTEDIYTLFDDCERGCVESCFVTSGRICQSRRVKVGSNYRIYAALCARPNGSRVIYSDDLGHTWNVLGGSDQYPALSGDESKCEELPDGRVVLSSRAKGGRIFNVFDFEDISTGKGKWGSAVFSGKGESECAALDNSCNGEILIVPAMRKMDGKYVNLVLQSVPLGPGRRNVGIYYKELPQDATKITSETFISGWKGPYEVSSTESAYSTMIQLRTDKIAIFYEETVRDDKKGYDLVYAELSLEEITGGSYR